MKICMNKFLFSFLIKIFFSNRLKIRNKKILFFMFLVEIKNLILNKIRDDKKYNYK